MNCGICQRAHDAQRRPFLCPVDARNRCYEPRVRNLQLLVETEDLQNEIYGVASDKKSTQLSLAQQQEAEDRTRQIIAQADRLRAAIAAAKTDIESRKDAITRRKSDLASASNGTAARRERQHKKMEKEVDDGRLVLDKCSEMTASTRSFLCMEAAKLYGLRRKSKGASGQYEYQIGQIEIIDLASMNSTFSHRAEPGLINASRSHGQGKGH
jgi:Vacuolar sorting 38 and autophagy-related subunit 14